MFPNESDGPDVIPTVIEQRKFKTFKELHVS